MAKKYILFKNGPAKSMCTLCHGFEGHEQGCNGADGGACLVDRHAWKDFSSCSMSLLRPEVASC